MVFAAHSSGFLYPRFFGNRDQGVEAFFVRFLTTMDLAGDFGEVAVDMLDLAVFYLSRLSAVGTGRCGTGNEEAGRALHDGN